MTHLVNDRPPNLLDDLGIAVADRADGTPADRGPCRPPRSGTRSTPLGWTQSGTTCVPVRIGDGRKPLASSQTLSENSQMASSTVSAERGPEGLSQAPNRTPIPPRRAKGPPIRPNITIGRERSLDRHIRSPRRIQLPRPAQNC